MTKLKRTVGIMTILVVLVGMVLCFMSYGKTVVGVDKTEYGTMYYYKDGTGYMEVE